METQPIAIDGVAGPIVVTTDRFGGRAEVTVNGRPAPLHGDRHHQLPATTGGTVDAVVRAGIIDPYPTVEVNGVRHRTGPAVSRSAKALAALPVVPAVLGGLAGGLVGVAGFLANGALLRSRLSPSVKMLAVAGVDAVVVVAVVAIVLAVRGATG